MILRTNLTFKNIETVFYTYKKFRNETVFANNKHAYPNTNLATV